MLGRFLLSICLILLAHTSHSAKQSVAMEEFGEIPFVQIESKEKTLDQLKNEIILSSRSLGWVPVAETADSVTLRWIKNIHRLDVRVSFTPKAFRIAYVDSEALGYSETPGGAALIHPYYNRWMKNLIKAINPTGYGVARPIQVADISTDVPEGFLAIHYHRTKRDWNGWGAHVWGNAFETDTSWFSPIQPAKIDGFGALYLIKANSSPSSDQPLEANYILHKGDVKDQCGKDMSWDPKRSRKIYVVENDCEVHYSLESALASKAFR